MGITAYSGPVLSFGQTQTSTGNGVVGGVADYNPQRGPSLWDLGQGMMDPRQAYCYEPGSAVSNQVAGFPFDRGVVDFIPGTVSTIAIVTTVVSTGVSGAFTLTAQTGRTISTTIIAPETGAATGTLLAIDSTAALISFGTDGTVAYWNPAAGTGRCVTINKSTTGDSGTYTIAGRDMYGFKMTETIVSSGNTSITSQKAFKYISSVTNCTTPVSTAVSIGISDTYGMPFLVSQVGPGNLTIAMSTGAGGGAVMATISPSTTTFVFGSTAATATSTTADTMGTWASSIASSTSAGNRLQIVVRPTVAQLAGITNTSVATLFGATQYSSV